MLRSQILTHAGDDGRALRLADDSSVSLSSTAAGWRHVKVEQQVLPPTELRDRYLTEHLLSVQIRPAAYAYRGTRGRTVLRPAPGDVVFTPAWLVSSFTWYQEIEVLNVALDPAFVDRLAPDVIGGAPARFPYERAGPDPQARMIVLALAAEARAEEHERGGAELVDALATALAVRVLRRYARPGPHLPPPDPSLRRAAELAARVRERVDAALDQPLTLTDLAAAENLSPFHFTRLFKAATGVSPYRYVTERRVERAKHLVLTSDLPVAEIARRCGFAAPAQMTRAFRRILSVTPTGLRGRR